MDKSQFVQEKIAYLHAYPQQHNDLAFYRYFTEKYPQETVGWLYLGREWERRGNSEAALEAYQQAIHCKPDAFYDEARDAYHSLLRAKTRRTRLQRIRRGLAALLLFAGVLLGLHSPAGDGAKDTPVATPQAPARQAADVRNHTEVIAIPAGMSTQQVNAQLKKYLLAQRPSPNKPFTLLLVPETTGTPLFTPLTFYRPVQVRGVLRYDPATQSFLSQKWYAANCHCDNDPALVTAKQKHRQEQQVVEQVLILRNALFRHYQRTGKLPQTLSDLAKGFPANDLPAIPASPAAAGKKADPNNHWVYDPSSFLPEQPWDSLTKVLPLPGYPEPSVALAPLRIELHLPSYRMTLSSGAQPVRSYSVGIGKRSSTPEGYYQIIRKINQPRGHDHIYGTRGMIFHTDAYAIHGTNAPSSIGAAHSLGCIRLHNADVEELYTFVSPGTDVVISAKPDVFPAWSNPERLVLPAGPEEETPRVVYQWLH